MLLKILSVLVIFCIGIFIGNALPIKQDVNSAHKIFSIIAGSVGLFLGYLYYKSKLEYDSKTSRENRLRKRIETIQDYLKIVELNFLKIVNMNFKDQAELETYKDLVYNNLFNISIFIDENEKLLNLSDSGILNFAKLHSYYEGVADSFELPLETLKKNLSNKSYRLELKNNFNNYLNAFKRECIYSSE